MVWIKRNGGLPNQNGETNSEKTQIGIEQRVCTLDTHQYFIWIWEQAGGNKGYVLAIEGDERESAEQIFRLVPVRIDPADFSWAQLQHSCLMLTHNQNHDPGRDHSDGDGDDDEDDDDDDDDDGDDDDH